MKANIYISIVNFNTKKFLEKCLNSIFKNSKDLKPEVIVIDNASTDRSLEMVRKKFPNVKLIQNSRNLFFSKAQNQALRLATSKYILVLNSDIFLPEGSLKKMISFMTTHSDCGAISCRMIDEKGKVDLSCSKVPNPLVEIFETAVLFKFFENAKLVRDYRYFGWKRDSIREVDILPGSLMLLKAKVLKKVGMFDENLELYYSDTDLSLRIRKAGYKLYHYAGVTVTHFRGQTIKQIEPLNLYNISEKDMLIFYKKYFGLIWYIILWIIFRPNWLYWKFKNFK